MLWSFFLQNQALTGFLQNKCSKHRLKLPGRSTTYLKSTSPWMFSSYKISESKNKGFAKQNKFFAMPMPTSMPMLMPTCRSRDFQMVILTQSIERSFLIDPLTTNNAIYCDSLRILTGKKHPKIKLERLRKIRIWTFGLLLHQINSF